MAGTGGKRDGAGRPTKVDEQKANNLFNRALKELYKADTEDEAKIRFIKDTLMDSQRGQLFIAEHIFGKAPQEIKQTNLNINKEDLTEKEVELIKNSLKERY